VNVGTARTCSWEAVSRAGWIRIDGRASDTGDGRVRFKVDDNDGNAARTGTALVAGRVVTFTQSPPEREVRLEGRVSRLAGSCPGLSFVVDGRSVATNADTRFDMSCRSIEDRSDVEVRGRNQPNGRVLAARVKDRK